MTATPKCLLAVAAITLGMLSMQARADVTLTLTKNTTLGGTDFSFSNGTGTVGSGASSNFLVGELMSSPLGYASTSYAVDTSLSVLSGTNVFGWLNIFSYYYGGGVTGTAGAIGQGFDFQGQTSIANASVSLLNGLVLNANTISYDAFKAGTYTLPSYYTGYNTNLGKFTLQVGAPAPSATAVPEPGSLALLGLGLAGFGVARRARRKA